MTAPASAISNALARFSTAARFNAGPAVNAPTAPRGMADDRLAVRGRNPEAARSQTTLSMASALVTCGSHQAADAVFRRAADQAQGVDIVANAGHAAAQAGAIAAAEYAYRRAVTLARTPVELTRVAGGAAADGLPALADEAFRRAADMTTNPTQAREVADAAYAQKFLAAARYANRRFSGGTAPLPLLNEPCAEPNDNKVKMMLAKVPSLVERGQHLEVDATLRGAAGMAKTSRVARGVGEIAVQQSAMPAAEYAFKRAIALADSHEDAVLAARAAADNRVLVTADAGYRKAADLATTERQARYAGFEAKENGVPAAAGYAFERAKRLPKTANTK